MQSLVEMQNHYNLENGDDGKIFSFSSNPTSSTPLLCMQLITNNFEASPSGSRSRGKLPPDLGRTGKAECNTRAQAVGHQTVPKGRRLPLRWMKMKLSNTHPHRAQVVLLSCEVVLWECRQNGSSSSHPPGYNHYDQTFTPVSRACSGPVFSCRTAPSSQQDPDLPAPVTPLALLLQAAADDPVLPAPDTAAHGPDLISHPVPAKTMHSAQLYICQRVRC